MSQAMKYTGICGFCCLVLHWMWGCSLCCLWEQNFMWCLWLMCRLASALTFTRWRLLIVNFHRSARLPREGSSVLLWTMNGIVSFPDGPSQVPPFQELCGVWLFCWEQNEQSLYWHKYWVEYFLWEGLYFLKIIYKEGFICNYSSIDVVAYLYHVNKCIVTGLFQLFFVIRNIHICQYECVCLYITPF